MSRLRLRAFPLILTALCLSLAPGLRAEVAVLDAETPARYAGPSPEFFAAAASGDLKALQQGLDEGVSPDAVVPVPTPPDLAGTFKPHTRGARLLNDPGATALMFATAYGHSDAMTLLLTA